MHHVLARVFKDLFLRYKTMRGYRAPRKGGWDTHGLPVELEVEHELGLGSKAEIEAYGIAAFNRRCRESVMRYVRDWEDLTERIAFWIDMEEPYATYDPQYVESCWWIFKTLWQHGLIYEARRTTPHCPRCETSLSSHELALGYRENTPDPSIFVKFRAQRASLPAALREFEGETYLVAWTTTPWTLAGNTALAIAPDAAYVVVAGEAGERLLLAEERLAATFAGLAEEVAPSPLATLPGRELVGLAYEGLYEPGTPGACPSSASGTGSWSPGSERREGLCRGGWWRRTSSRWRRAAGSSTSPPPSARTTIAWDASRTCSTSSPST